MFKEMKRIGRTWLTLAMLTLVAHAAGAASASGPWEEPAAALAGQIADILGPGQARLAIRNISSIPPGEIPAIRNLLVQDLKARGVTISGAESASIVHITLSENSKRRLWVAEVGEGDQMQVAMVSLALEQPAQEPAAGKLLLRSETIFTAKEPVLAVLEVANDLAVLEPDVLVIDAPSANGWQQQKRVNAVQSSALSRDPRGVLMPAGGSGGFEAWLPGTRCTGNLSSAGDAKDWTVQCGPSDDPWTLAQAPGSPPPAQSGAASPSENQRATFKAFFNSARNYFTGVVSPSLGVDLPAFYSAALIPRAAGNAALLMDGIDGKVQLVENNALHPVAGARDWGSDFALLRSDCGSGAQIVASGSGEAASDSLRAYELPALEAVPASAPLAMDGTITAIWPAPDQKSVYAVVRTPANQYEVDRVSALCN